MKLVHIACALFSVDDKEQDLSLEDVQNIMNLYKAVTSFDASKPSEKRDKLKEELKSYKAKENFVQN